MNALKLALPTGDPRGVVLDIMARAGITATGYEPSSRVVRSVVEEEGFTLRVFRERDIPVQVALGNYDMGICGDAWLAEVQARFPLQRLVRIAELDASALNRIIALDGLEVVARAQAIDLVAGLDQGDLQALASTDLQPLLDGFRDLRPTARQAPLSAAHAARYEQVLTGLSAQPLATWSMRAALVADLAASLQSEPERRLRELTGADFGRRAVWRARFEMPTAAAARLPTVAPRAELNLPR